ALAPNHDPGRNGIVQAIEEWGGRTLDHLPRDRFVGLLKRLASARGVLVGNSSAGLIEAAVLGVPVVDIGRRQGGRERPAGVIHEDVLDESGLKRAMEAARAASGQPHPYGDGHAGERIAAALVRVDPQDPALLRKRNTY
ncbi:MAG: UDP-N-acetylglucosamine 2-epimerase, partial [bacterium]|nr:UDP-N-acetylglucosamine 2-epimerase [bacterium]